MYKKPMFEMEPCGENLPKRGGNYFSLEKQKEIEMKKAEEEKIKKAEQKARMDGFREGLDRGNYNNEPDEDDWRKYYD